MKQFFMVSVFASLAALSLDVEAGKYKEYEDVPPKTLGDIRWMSWTKFGKWRAECEKILDEAAPTNGTARVLRQHMKLFTCKDEDLAAEGEKYRKLLVEPNGEAPADQLGRLKNYNQESAPVEVDVLGSMKIIKDRYLNDDNIQRYYYCCVIDYMWHMYDDGIFFPKGQFDPKYCHEAKLAFLDSGEKDPALKDKSILQPMRRRILFAMQRWDDYEKNVAEQMALYGATNLQIKGSLYLDLADYFWKRSQRFYAPRGKLMLEKSLENALKALEITRQGVGIPRFDSVGTVLRAAILLDVDTYEKCVNDLYRFKEGEDKFAGRNGVPYAKALGLIAYRRGEYAKAVEYYSKIDPKTWRGMAIENDGGRFYLESLIATGDLDKAIEVAELFSQQHSGNWKEYYATSAANLKARKGK